MPRTLLPDVNVWIGQTFDSHVHHPAAKTWFDALTDEICLFCRMTQQGFLRLTTNRQIYGAVALTMDDAWLHYDTFQSDPRVSFADEPAGVELLWRSFTKGQSYATKVW